MSVITVDAPALRLMLQNDAQKVREFISYVDQRYQAYAQNATVGNMTAAGFSTEDQNAVLAFIGDFNRLKMLMSGVLPSDATDMKYDCALILGVY